MWGAGLKLGLPEPETELRRAMVTPRKKVVTQTGDSLGSQAAQASKCVVPIVFKDHIV